MGTRPIIGIVTNLDNDPNHLFPGYPRITQNEDYARSITEAGGVPLLLPPSPELGVLDDQLPLLDGLVLAGGPDVDPHVYGQEPHTLCGAPSPVRDRFELAALKLARERRLPTLGICRGLQVINVFAGGTLVQDLSLTTSTTKHMASANPSEPVHRITIEPGSFLHRLWETTDARVNSFHHQGIDRLGWQLRVVARSSDALVEAIEWANADFPLIAVQWHPEMMTLQSEQARALFTHFVRMAGGQQSSPTPRRRAQV